MKKVYLLIILKSLFITIFAQNGSVGRINFSNPQKTSDVASLTPAKVAFAVIGDYGFSGSNEAAVANLVKSWNPDFIITLGDNNYELGESWSIDRNIGQYYQGFIFPYSGTYGAGADSNRFFPSLGNHDLYTNSGAAYKQYFTLPGNERYYDYIKGNIHFFVINSDPTEADGVSSSSIQALWLKNKLQNSTSKWNIVYFHHSPYCSDAAHGSVAYMRWPFKNWGADVVLSSHSHVYERLIVDSLPYFVNGLGGKSLVAFSPTPLAQTMFRYNSDYGAMLCNEYDDTLTFRFYNKGGTLIDSYLITKTPPVISIILSAPLNNSAFPLGTPITMNATVTGGIGGIRKVDFFSGTIKLDTDSIYPYSFSWTNAQPGYYSLTAFVIDSSTNSVSSAPCFITVYDTVICSASGTITRDFWANVSGTSVSSVPINIAPTSTSQLTVFEGPSNFADNYGSRIRGYLCPPSTGDYIFWIASDDNSELWLSTTDQPANKVKIASVPGYTASRSWTKYTAQQSSPKNLIGGVRYYIEAIHKDGSQGDNLAVGWQLPDGTFERPIPGTRISPFNIPLLVNIISPINNSSYSVGSSITIQAAVSGGTGTIQKVEFFADSTKIAEDETSPYSFIWNNLIAGNYDLTARVTVSGNDSALSEPVTISVDSIVACTATGSIAREVWNNVSGSSVSAIPLSINPSLTGQLTIFEAPQNFSNNYGQRISGYICPPLTGNYIFWIASDNNSELWLSLDETPANKQKIASVSGYTSSRQWTKYSTQKSISKNLIAGQNYYIEALHKEGSQGDNCAVGWQLPSGVQERPIPGNRLSPFELIPSIQLISSGSSWKYLDNGTNQGTAWRSTSFNDATWKSGNAEFGYGDGGEATVVSYGPSSTNKYITTYFRKPFTVTDISTISGLELSLIRDDGAVVYINGVEVYRSNLPSGTIFYNTLAPTIIDASKESIYLIANISSSALVNGTNYIAVEIHQNAKTSPDMSFNLKLKTLSGSRIIDNNITNDTTQENVILENTVEMIVYPNPNTGQFNLELCMDDLQEKNVVIEVTNSFGQVIYKKLPQKIKDCIKETIELEANLAIGIYILKVTINDKIQTSKMLLMK